jgi:hypothetical protein
MISSGSLSKAEPLTVAISAAGFLRSPEGFGRAALTVMLTDVGMRLSIPLTAESARYRSLKGRARFICKESEQWLSCKEMYLILILSERLQVAFEVDVALLARRIVKSVHQ